MIIIHPAGSAAVRQPAAGHGAGGWGAGLLVRQDCGDPLWSGRYRDLLHHAPGDYAGLTAEGGALTCGEDTIPCTVELKDAYGGPAPLQFLAGESFTATISIAETAF